MKVKIQCLGWTKAADNLEWQIPYGYYTYLCTAANGIVVKQYIAKTDPNNGPIPDGEYELSDEDWSFDNPRWDKEIICEEIEIQ